MPAATAAALTSVNPKIGLMVSAAEHLIPLFESGDVDVPLARNMAMSAIAAYNPATRADIINIARTIAFSMAALALLAKAARVDMTAAEQMRAYGRANALNRSADHSERMMMVRREYDKANPAEQLPAWMDPGPEKTVPGPTIDDAVIRAGVAEAMAAYRACNGPAPAEVVAPKVMPKPVAAVPQAMPTLVTAAPQARPAVGSIHPTAATPATAIRYGGPRSDVARGPTTYKETLLRDSAMQRVVEESGRQQAGARTAHATG